MWIVLEVGPVYQETKPWLGEKLGSSIVPLSYGLGSLLQTICVGFLYCAGFVRYVVAMLGKLPSPFLWRTFSYANFDLTLCSAHLLVPAQLELDFIRALKVSRSCDPFEVPQNRRLRSYYSSQPLLPPFCEPAGASHHHLNLTGSKNKKLAF